MQQQKDKKDTKKTKKEKQIVLEWDVSKLLSKLFVFALILLLFLPAIFSFFTKRSNSYISLSKLIQDIRDKKVVELDVAGNNIDVVYEDGTYKYTRMEENQSITTVLNQAGVDITQANINIESLAFSRFVQEIIGYVVMFFVMSFILLFIMKQMRGPDSGGILGFGKSRAKIYVKGKQKVTFDDIGGMEEVKTELREVVDFLKNPKKYKKVGARTPKGVLLVGPSGTGKTLLARAVAGEADVQFLSIAGSEFMEMLVGVGASRVRDLFSMAKKLAPSIIFIDEIDAIGRVRGRGYGGGHDEREQTLNQILVEMDGFTPNDNVVVIAATNRGDILDPALIRPGRFDRRVLVTLPNLEERKHIIKIHMKGKPFADDVTVEKIAMATIGFSGADIENTLNEAAIKIARENRDKITMADIDDASMKVKYGPSKKRLDTGIEKEMTAYHEAGHAIVAHLSKYADPVHRISIISRGEALGYTFTPPKRDRLQIVKQELLDSMKVLMGGRAAEKLIFNEETAGASSDIAKATRIARQMVTEYGMSSLGIMNFLPQYETSDYAKIFPDPYKISDELQYKVDQEILKLVQKAYDEAYKLLEENKDKLEKVAKALIEKEILDADEFEKLMGVKKASPDKE